MNCAYLKVVGASTSFTAPKMFVANVGQCTTTEGVEISFPNPGDNVEYGGSYAGQTNVPATSDCTAGNNYDVIVVGSGSSGGNLSSSSSSSAGTVSRSTLIATTLSTVTTTSKSSGATTTTGSSVCNTGAIQCSSDGLSWSVCVNGAFVSIGPVSSGTKCVDGAIICAGNSSPDITTVTPSQAATTPAGNTSTSNSAATTSSSTSGDTETGCTSGAIKCAADGKSWSMCSNNAYVFMGAVAPGMSSQIAANVRNDMCGRKNAETEIGWKGE
jgi:hypothetical protein